MNQRRVLNPFGEGKNCPKAIYQEDWEQRVSTWNGISVRKKTFPGRGEQPKNHPGFRRESPPKKPGRGLPGDQAQEGEIGGGLNMFPIRVGGKRLEEGNPLEGGEGKNAENEVIQKELQTNHWVFWGFFGEEVKKKEVVGDLERRLVSV